MEGRGIMKDVTKSNIGGEGGLKFNIFGVMPFFNGRLIILHIFQKFEQ